MKNVYVLCGGISVEHEVSLRSAQSIINNLDKEKYDVYPIYIDKKGSFIPLDKVTAPVENSEDLIRVSEVGRVRSIGKFLSENFHEEADNIFIPVIHGTTGEDGVIQGFLEALNVPYVGNGILSSAICMDKAVTNQMLTVHHVDQGKYYILNSDLGEATPYDAIEDHLGYPVFVKPSNAGSSIGINRARNREELIAALKEAFRYDRKVVIEEEVVGMEVQVSVVGNADPRATLPGACITDRDFFDYYAKYQDKTLQYLIPVPLSPEETAALQETAIRAYKATGCSGFARVDIFIRDGDRRFLVNEINTFPGMTTSSLTSRLWNVTDATTFPELLDWLIDLAQEEYETKQHLIRTL